MPPHITPTLRIAAASLMLGLPWLGSSCRQTPSPQPEPTITDEASGAVAPVAPVDPVAPGDPADLSDAFRGTSRSGTYEIAWRPLGGPIPLNELFELEVLLTESGPNGAPVAGAEVVVQADMPEHRHGMLREPRAHEVEPGVYRVEGMLLHMTGYWKVFIDVIRDGVAETAEFELTLE